MIIECDLPKWNQAGHIYDYVELVEAHCIKEFLPICFAIMSYGEAKITMNLFTVDETGNFLNNSAVRL